MTFLLLFTWKNVGIWQWHRCDVMNIMWRKTQMTEEKSEEMGREGRRRGRERELLRMWWSDLGKGRRLPVPNIPGGEWENQSTWGGNPLVRCSENPVLVLMRVSLPSKLRKTTKATKQQKKGRGGGSYTCAHTLSDSHTCKYYCSSMVGYSEGIGGSGR